MSFNLNDAKNAIGNLAKGFEKGGGLLSGIDLPLINYFPIICFKNSVFKTAKEF